MNKRLLLLVTLATTLSSLAIFAPPADAVTTLHFSLDNAASLAAGELDGTMVHSRGHVTVGAQTTRIELAEAVVAHSIARDGDTVYVGSGNDGKIFKVTGDQVSVFAETGQLLVRSLLMHDGTLYAGTLPEGRIYKIDSAGAVSELARPENAEHIWDLAWRGNRLIAATGPEGKVFSISTQGQAELLYDSEAAHVMTLAVDGDSLYAGTSDDALLLKLNGPGDADVVYDFPGNEVTAISARGGVIAAVANEFAAPRAGTSKVTKGPSRPRAGKGRLWRVEGDRAERIFSRDDGHFTDVELAESGAIFVAGGKQGRIFRVATDRTSATYLDVDERQVLALSLTGSSPIFTTGDGAAIYRVREGRPENAMWQSKVLDARFSARFGQLTWRGDGSFRFSTRSGNTAEPDDSWTDWSAPMTSPGPTRSQGARYVQVRAQLTGADDVLRAVTLYYLPQNQRATITSVGLKRRASAKRGKAKSAARRATATAPSTTYNLTWTIENPDGDPMRYRIRFRNENQSVWRDVLREDEQLTATNYAWQTNGLPDGYYVVEVSGSDEQQNPEELTQRSATESEPILIDNHPPRIEGLVARRGNARGRAIDSLGPIAKLEYAIDGGEWRMFFPKDHLLDTNNEEFELALPEGLDEGQHILAIRATDAGNNTVSAELEF